MEEESKTEPLASTVPRRAKREHRAEKGDARNIFREGRRSWIMVRALTTTIYPTVRFILVSWVDRISCLLLLFAAMILQFSVNAELRSGVRIRCIKGRSSAVTFQTGSTIHRCFWPPQGKKRCAAARNAGWICSNYQRQELPCIVLQHSEGRVIAIYSSKIKRAFQKRCTTKQPKGSSARFLSSIYPELAYVPALSNGLSFQCAESRERPTHPERA